VVLQHSASDAKRWNGQISLHDRNYKAPDLIDLELCSFYARRNAVKTRKIFIDTIHLNWISIKGIITVTRTQARGGKYNE